MAVGILNDTIQPCDWVTLFTSTYASGSLYVEADSIHMTTARKSDLPQGTLDLLLLTVIAGGPQHGYAIAQRLQQISREAIQVRQGSLYPALHRLENRGLLSTGWRRSETGRQARYYSLTRKGVAALERERSSWRQLAKAVSLVLRTAEGGVS